MLATPLWAEHSHIRPPLPLASSSAHRLISGPLYINWYSSSSGNILHHQVVPTTTQQEKIEKDQQKEIFSSNTELSM
jgi:hypothetical protein